MTINVFNVNADGSYTLQASFPGYTNQGFVGAMGLGQFYNPALQVLFDGYNPLSLAGAPIDVGNPSILTFDDSSGNPDVTLAVTFQ